MHSQSTTYPSSYSYYPYYAATNELTPCACQECLAKTTYVHSPYGHAAAQVQPIVHTPAAYNQEVSLPLNLTPTRRTSTQSSSALSPKPLSLSTSQASSNSDLNRGQMTVTMDMLLAAAGTMCELARTPNGSSFLQAGLKAAAEAHSIIYSELAPRFPDLLLDTNGCYVVRALLEPLPYKQFAEVVRSLAADEQFLVSLCTQSLHSRRMVQFMLDRLQPNDVVCFAKVIMRRCRDIAKTQQGCISIQRTLDRCDDHQRRELFTVIALYCVEFAMDPFANYVVQYLLETGKMAVELYYAFAGNIVILCCNKFSSNVIEKCLYHWTPELQHAVLNEIFGARDADLIDLLQDSFGNYIVQSAIALATFKDLWEISNRLAPLLPLVPYGQKIESKIMRRLRGKTMPRDPVAPVGCC